MTRTEAIALITAKLASLDDEHVLTVADIIASIDESQSSTRRLSQREADLVSQSKADFAAGRTLSHSEVVSKLDARLAALGVPKSVA